jgi:hypothetical protein
VSVASRPGGITGTGGSLISGIGIAGTLIDGLDGIGDGTKIGCGGRTGICIVGALGSGLMGICGGATLGRVCVIPADGNAIRMNSRRALAAPRAYPRILPSVVGGTIHVFPFCLGAEKTLMHGKGDPIGRPN